jgi:hypothetical protein
MIRYKAVVHDGDVARTMEQQTWLLAQAAEKAWRAYFNRYSAQAHDMDDPLRFAMRELYAQLKDTDIFMAGWRGNEREVEAPAVRGTGAAREGHHERDE